jgi:hypothetical protein
LPYAIAYALSGLITSSDHDWATPYGPEKHRKISNLPGFNYQLVAKIVHKI